MTTRLDKTLKRELMLDGRAFILSVSPEGLKLTLKGKRNGQELRWSDLISGDAALASALNASLGTFAADPAPQPKAPKNAARPRKKASPARTVSTRARAARRR